MDELELTPTPMDPSHPVVQDMYEQLEKYPELADEIIEDAVFAYNPIVTNIDYDAVLGRKPVPGKGETWEDVWRSLFVRGTAEAAALDALLYLLPEKGRETDWQELHEQMTGIQFEGDRKSNAKIQKAMKNRLDAINRKFDEAKIEKLFMWERGVIRRIR